MMRSLTIAIIVLVLVGGVARAAEEPIVAKVAVNADKVIRDVPPLRLGHNMEWVWGGQRLFKPDGSGPVDGFVPLISALKPGLIRYPGGSLSNSFRFADSLGPLAQRTPVGNFFSIHGDSKDKVTYKSERPLLGFDDFMAFVAATEAQGAIITVNCTVWPQNPELSGSAQEAAAWVAYANAGVDDAPVAIGMDERKIDWKDSQYWANLRKQNGFPEPWGVKYWEIGNEVYDVRQGAGVKGPEYAARVNEFATLMKSVDPTIKVGTVIVLDIEEWNDPVVKGAADGKGLVDFLIVHHYAGGSVAMQSFPLWTNSSRPVPIRVEKAGTYEIILEAAGQPCAGVFPLMKLELDGTGLGTVSVDANKNQKKRKEYRFTKELAAGAHTFTISFLNDEYKPPEDRNLFLEALYLQPEVGTKQRLSFISPEEMMQNLAASAEILKSRYLDSLDALQKKYGTSLPAIMTEYGVIYGLSYEELRKSSDLKGALASARLAQIALEDPRIIASNFWCIRSAWFLIVEPGPAGWRYAPSGLALSTLVPLSSGQVVETKVECPMVKAVDVSYPIPWINVLAVRDGSTLALNFISWHPTRATNLELAATGLAGSAWNGRILRLVGPKPNTQNEDHKPALIVLEEERDAGGELTVPLKLNLKLLPCSVTTLLIEAE